MNKFGIVLTVIILIGSIGCSERPNLPDSQGTTDSNRTVSSESLQPKSDESKSVKSSASTANQDQLLRLFSTTWEANQKATMAYSGNQSSDLDALKTFAWLHCIQLKTIMFFMDDGLKWETTRQKSFVDLPVKSAEFKDKIRVIDKYHFAFNEGTHWLVFRSLDWDDDHYHPPK